MEEMAALRKIVETLMARMQQRREATWMHVWTASKRGWPGPWRCQSLEVSIDHRPDRTTIEI